METSAQSYNEDAAFPADDDASDVCTTPAPQLASQDSAFRRLSRSF